MKRLLVSLSLCLLCSCSAHLYKTSNHNISETQVVLDKANFTVIGTVSGSASASYILGIGGLSQESLKGNAVTKMYENANLTGSQAIINVTFKQRVSNILIYSEVEYTASGSIVEFFDGERPIVCSQTTANLANNKKENTEINTEYHNIDKESVKNVNVQKRYIVSKSETYGTWYDAIEYCKTLGEGWILPNKEQIDYICENYDIKFSNCWTATEVNDKKAKAYYRGYTLPNQTMPKSTNNIGIIAIKDVDNDDIE